MLQPGPVYQDGRFVPAHLPGRPGEPETFTFLRTLFSLPAIARNPLSGFAEFQYNDPVSKYLLFGKPFALINDPEMIRHIFVEKAGALTQEKLRQKILKSALRDGMLTAEGDVWRKARRAIAPIFSPRHVEGFAKPMRRTVDRFIEEMKAGPEQILLAPQMSRLAFLILSETLFSGEINAEGEQILRDTASFIDNLSRPDPLDLMNMPEWLPRVTRMRGHSSTNRLRDIVGQAGKRRQTRMEKGESVPDDFLSLLLRAGEDEKTRLTMDEIEDNILTFIAAGHETTARAVTWTLYLLAHDRDAMARARNEADALDAANCPAEQWGSQLPWITACFEEAMRLFPPAAILMRTLTENISHNGLEIEKGRNVFICQFVLHRHKTLWKDPNSFIPDRFFGENRKKIGRFAYLPFGLGPRVCIGASFAMQEAQIMLALLLRAFDFSYAGMEMPKPVMKITIQPDNNMPMRIRPRDPARAS